MLTNCPSVTVCQFGLGVHNKLGEDIARTGDPNRPKGYSVPYDIMFRNKTRKEVDGVAAAGDWLSIVQVLVSNWFHLHHLSFLWFFFPVIFLFVTFSIILIIKLFLSQPTSFFTLPFHFASLHPTVDRVNKQLCGA